ncbi:MAG: ATP-binding protein [Muribaculaceae bacterium]
MISEQVLLQVLSEQKDEMVRFSPTKYVIRAEQSLIDIDSPLAQVVIGVRRSGKSTLCAMALKAAKVNFAYVNFDDDRLADIQTNDLNTILSCIYQIYGTDIKHILLDEAQDVVGWHLFVNRLLRSGMRVFVTGSNAKLLSSELATHLTGRYNEVKLFPFSFAEFCEYRKLDIHSITTKGIAEVKKAFIDYLHIGGFPELANIRNKKNYVNSLITAIIEKDIKLRFKIRDIDSLKKLTFYLLDNIGQIINYDDLSSILNINDKTLRKYVSFLEQAFLIKTTSRFSFKASSRIRNQKSYIIDTGIQDNRHEHFSTDNIGWKIENVVYIELLRRCSNDFLDVYYFKKDSKSKEVDFVITDGRRVLQLIQVSYIVDNPKTLERELSALTSASSSLRCDNLTLIAATDTKDVILHGKTIHIVNIIEWLSSRN